MRREKKNNRWIECFLYTSIHTDCRGALISCEQYKKKKTFSFELEALKKTGK